ncbi:Lrp/AsnC family transcriptional regulator [Bacillus sp. mrc49]|uniref:Lrp/AsnC family transcriptional regulator n=1 Tax=Bacillus sp. mrc49 TaxID=2054913 RepID=UPI000C278B17|nr:Lrp/AsnC family transcriptional regulator [Bacillus sp. mrc49]PJN86660.1 AsnC family transcriptional regulator [Bacillus sp. mrc49]
MKIDEKDRDILAELTLNNRVSMRELAKKVGLSAPTVTERVRQMESFGIIKGYVAEIDHKKIGFPIECIVEATIKNGEYEKFKMYISKLPNVDFCYRIAGQACFMLKIRSESLEKVEEFINQTIPFAATVTHVILSEVERKHE